MIKIWLLILAGIILVPTVSTLSKELEERLKKIREKNYQENNGDKLKNKDDLEFVLKLLKYGVIVLFVIITLVMIRFTSQIIASK
jgi:hypothetical protein